MWIVLREDELTDCLTAWLTYAMEIDLPEGCSAVENPG